MSKEIWSPRSDQARSLLIKMDMRRSLFNALLQDLELLWLSLGLKDSPRPPASPKIEPPVAEAQTVH